MDFAEFYQASKDQCLSAIAVAVGDRDRAEELLAEAFARAWERWRSVSGHANPTAWVIRTALNINISRWRRERRETPLDHADLADMTTEPAADPAVMRAVLALPRRQREVIALRIILDLDTQTTAGLLKIAPTTVGVHLHRALHQLEATLIRQESQP